MCCAPPWVRLGARLDLGVPATDSDADPALSRKSLRDHDPNRRSLSGVRVCGRETRFTTSRPGDMTRAHVTPFEFVARQAPRPQGLPDVNSAYLEQARGACRCGRPLLARARHAPWRHAPARGARRGRASRRLVAAWSLVRCSRGGPLRTRDAKQISVGQCGRKALVCAAARAWRCRSPHHIRVLVCFERREAPLLHHQVPFEVLLWQQHHLAEGLSGG